ncbi:MAG: hypothetical protein R3338_04980 [Thermoanaerobaculia bacterium]|nr:hypothetical protein [Thermoanaerobaculia bacterium]
MTIHEEAHAVLRLRARNTIRVQGPVEIDQERQIVLLPEEDSDQIAFSDLKAVFFITAQPAQVDLPSSGSHVTVEFDDGEVISGISPEYKPTLPGFYLYPEGEERVERVFVIASAIVSIDIDRL